MDKLNIAVLYGGISAEHEVSVHSAEDVCRVLSEKYNVIPIYIGREGDFFVQKSCGFKKPDDIQIKFKNPSTIVSYDGKLDKKIALFFPVLHGPYGEDGKIQGFLETYGCKYVGCGVLSSSMAMDKSISKRIAKSLDIPTLEHIEISKNYNLEEIKSQIQDFGYPIFVKPTNLGSSIGITKVKNEENLEFAIKEALKHDHKVILEKGLESPREIFCGILEKSDNSMKISKCGELMPSNHEFFDYEAKYNDPKGCIAQTPAKIDDDIAKKMRKFSEKIFATLNGRGFARVDFLLTKENEIYFSEINTIPGLSEKSLFPQLFSASDINYEELLDTIIKSRL